MKKFVAILMLSYYLFGASENTTSVTASTFVGYGDYSGGDKQSSRYGGLYAEYFESPYKVQCDIEHIAVDYKNETPKYQQSDVTVVANYYKGYNSSFKVGIHNIFINQDGNPNNYDNIIFLGLSYYEIYKKNLGLDVYRSDYDGFNVIQVSPKYGFAFGDPKSKFGSFYAEFQANFINISRVGFTNKRDYKNIDLSLKNYNGSITTELFVSLGDNSYKVGKGGFSVYNQREEYKYTVGTSVSYNFKNGGNVKATYSRSKLNDGEEDIRTNSYIFSFSTRF